MSDSGFPEAPAAEATTDSTAATRESTPAGELARQEEARQPDVRVIDKRWWMRGEQGAAAETPSLKPSYVEELERRLADQQSQVQSYAAKYREAAQDFEQARVRLRREVSREVEREKRAILAGLLEVLDNLDRAIDAARTGALGSSLLQGVELVRSQFLAKLEAHGVIRIEALGQPFDPAVHEAVATVPVSNPAQENAVVAVVRPGYRIGDEVLRPATVAVGRTLSQPQDA